MDNRDKDRKRQEQVTQKPLTTLPLLPQQQEQVDQNQEQEPQYRQHLDYLPNLVGIYLDHVDAKIPTCAYAGDVGYDLYAIEDVIVPVGCVCLVKTGVHLSMPKNIFVQINTRSSYGKQGILLHHGVVDSGYTGELSVWVMNLAKPVDPQGVQLIAPFIIKKGDKIGQLLFHKAERVNIKQISELPETARGNKGCGSSGR